MLSVNLTSLSRSLELSWSLCATDEVVKRSDARPLSSDVPGSWLYDEFYSKWERNFIFSVQCKQFKVDIWFFHCCCCFQRGENFHITIIRELTLFVWLFLNFHARSRSLPSRSISCFICPVSNFGSWSSVIIVVNSVIADNRFSFRLLANLIAYCWTYTRWWWWWRLRRRRRKMENEYKLLSWRW